MVCTKCGNTSTPEFYLVCEKCYAKNSPRRIHNSDWIRIVSPTEKKPNLQPIDPHLTDLIITSFYTREVYPDPARRVVVVGRRTRLEIAIDEKNLDDVARRSGILIGKWLIHESENRIDKSWNAIARCTLDGELGIDAKVLTARQAARSNDFVICVYTANYFDYADVSRVRLRLRELGYSQTLYYKPDLYTYLNIYKRTFPNAKASRYAD